MKVLEIKNNLVKIAYDAADNLALSSFVVIQDVNTPYVAQVMNLKADVTSNYAIVKLLFTFNEDGILKNYNGTIPSLKSTITKLPTSELLDIIPTNNPLKIGVLAEQETILKVDQSILENNLLICSNNTENTARLVKNISTQLKDKVIVFDNEGTLGLNNTISLGKDFKLPLNYDTINFIYDNDLEDIDATSKAIIQDIFLEVQEYTKTLPEGYLPFDSFLNVVDQQYKETGITQLVLLKNKLLKYKEANVFAQTLKDVLNFSMAIEKSDFVSVDLSNISPILQKEVMTYAYHVINSVKSKIYSFAKIDNDNTDKKLLKILLEKSNVFTTIICPHEYKYINILKENAQNMILFAPLTLQHDFASYNTLLNKLNADEFIIYGAHTQNIPLITVLEDSYEEVEKTDEPYDAKNEQEIQENLPSDDITTEKSEQDSEPEITDEQVIEENIYNTETEYPEEIEYPDITIEEPVEIVETPQEEEISEEDNIIPNILADEVPQENALVDETVDQNGEDTNIDDIKVEPLYDNASLDELAESEEITIEEPEIEISSEDTHIVPDDVQQSEQNEDDIVQQVAKDVDKAFYEKLDNDEQVSFDDIETDELTEDDLNLIDDINSDNIEDNNIEITDYSEENPPVLPIYPGEDIETEENQKLEPGDRVSTPKYGEGVVEKMIKYGNKMLCSIEFPNIGRRLLDPAMSDITKLS